MDAIFRFVASTLHRISLITGLTYSEINIVLYYIIIPFTWIILIDRIFRFHYLKVFFGLTIVVSLLLIKDFRKFSDWLFHKSTVFINFFGDYTVFSVIICVFVVIIIYMILIYFAFINRREKS